MSVSDPIPPRGAMSTRTAAIVIVVIALVAGILLGVAGDRAYLFSHRRLAPPQHGPGMVPFMVRRLDHELHLTDAQKTAITQILEQRRTRVEALMNGVRPQVRQEIDRTDAEISRLLTPEQRSKYETIRRRMNRRHDRDHRGGPGL